MKRRGGFTLVELIVVMVIIGILAGTLTIYFVPAIQNYLAVQRRANLTDMVDGAVRNMTRDIRAAVANSIRSPNTQCFELVPAAAGGRYRKAADTATNASRWVDPLEPVTVFDVLSPLATAPAVGDFVVINNQNTDDVYSGASRSTVTKVEDIPAETGTTRLTIAALNIAAGYDNARFATVPAAQQAVFYFCAGADDLLNANGDGNGILYRASGYDFNANANACPAVNDKARIVATKVQSCAFSYQPNIGNTTATGYMQLQLRLTEKNESVQILVGTHADNTP